MLDPLQNESKGLVQSTIAQYIIIVHKLYKCTQETEITYIILLMEWRSQSSTKGKL